MQLRIDTFNIGGWKVNLVIDGVKCLRNVILWELYLVQNRNDLEPSLSCHMEDGDGLGLDALGGINEQQGALACCQAVGLKSVSKGKIERPTFLPETSHAKST